MCDSALFHILREQNISLSAFAPTNAMLAKERTENFHSLSFSVCIRFFVLLYLRSPFGRRFIYVSGMMLNEKDFNDLNNYI